MSAMGRKKTLARPAFDAASAVCEGESIGIFEAVNFVDARSFAVLLDRLVCPDPLARMSRLSDSSGKIGEADVAMRLHE